MSRTGKTVSITSMQRNVFFIAAILALSLSARVTTAQDLAPPAPEAGLAWLDPDTAPGTSEEADTQKAKDYMAAIVSMRADFVQIAPNNNVSAGKLVLERPGKIRFDYDDPSPLLIVGDGKVINLIDYELRQVTKWPIMRTPLRPLVSQDIVYGKDVKITGVARDAAAIGVTMVDPKNERDGELRLVFTREPFALSRWEVTDAQGNITIVALANVQTNIAVEKKAFRFDDPRPKRRRIPGRR